jgi:hypothetical protein
VDCFYHVGLWNPQAVVKADVGREGAESSIIYSCISKVVFKII